MRKLSSVFLIILLAVAAFQAAAQVKNPATWTFTMNPAQPKAGQTAELIFDVKLQDGWYIYGNDFAADLGPTRTTAIFTKSDAFELVDSLQAVNPKSKFDEIWQGKVSYFTHDGRFVQKIKILKDDFQIAGKLDYQTCTEKDGQCIPGKTDFTFGGTAETAAAAAVPVENAAANATATQSTPTEETSLWKFLLMAFGAGIASIFMPCIYPIMPMTVSFFTKQTNGRSKVIFYGLSIMAIFAVIGLVTMAFGAPFLNFISTHWLPNLIFFLIFILFGVSLLGAFEIVLPHSTVNKIDRMSDKGGLLGIFFMALTLVVVSFSCTVPFVGSLLIFAAKGEVWRPLYGMLAFGLPFALVFTLLAMFPQYLKTLPKSGSWLNELKVVFGFLEFALALKFLSNIDLAYHFNLLHRNIFLVLWILIFFIIGLYILGFLRMPKDSPVAKRTPLRWFFALIFFGFTAYMIPGVANRPLGLLSGILPPMPTATAGEASTAAPAENMRALPHGLQGFYDYDDALAYAKQVNKPVLIDFTGYACANCRKMEENVWPNEEVLAMLKNDFVIASLYVDDKKPLPKEKQYTSTYDDELKTTVGDKNMDLEITKYNNNAQPYYAVVDANGNKLTEPLGYVSTEEFIAFLKAGKSKFGK